MPEQVSKAHKTFLAAKKEYFKLAEKTDKAITRERDVLKQKLKRTNAKLKKSRVKLVAAEKKFQKSSTEAAKNQVENMQKLLDEAKSEAIELRGTLQSVGERFKASREYTKTAKFLQRGIESLDREWNKLIEKKEKMVTKNATVKKSSSKKIGKKKVVKKTAAKKKIVKKTPAKKKVTKKAAAKKKVVKKTAAKKKVSRKPA